MTLLRTHLSALLVLVCTSVTALSRAQTGPGSDAPSKPGRVRVWLVSNHEGATLERRRKKSNWEVICSAPCGNSYSTDFEYRVAGEGIGPSSPIDLGAVAGKDEVTVRAEAPSRGRKIGGVVMMSVGALALLSGAWLGWRATQGEQNVGDRPASGAAAGYFLLAGAGAACLGFGIYFLVERTSVVIEEGARLPGTSPGDTRVPLALGTWLSPRGLLF